jgi:hypothetical protein
MDRILEAMKMIESFIGMGVDRFDVTRTTIDKKGCSDGFRPGQSWVRCGLGCLI